jgi:transcriptional regulator with XRE-family HTH domain
MSLVDITVKMASSRKSLGLSQNELARQANLSLATIQNIESGRNTNPSLDVLVRLTDILGLQVSVSAVKPDWQLLAAHGVPLLNIDKKLKIEYWQPKEFVKQLKFALHSDLGIREKKAILSFAWALFDHYPQYAKNNGFEFLFSYLASYKNILTDDCIKLRRIALTNMQKFL